MHKTSLLIRGLTGLLALLLTLFSLPGQAQELMLDTIRVSEQDGNTVIHINLLRPVQYLGHTPLSQGTLLQVDIEPTSYSDMGSGKFEAPERETLFWKGDERVPLSRVVYQEENHTHRLFLYFQKAVKFSVRSAPDLRSIIVTLPETAKAPILPPEGRDTAPTIDYPALGKAQQAELDEAMESGRQAILAGNYPEAIAAYTQVLRLPPNPDQQQAQELLGLARERNGQLAHAKAEYETYLQRYPDGPDASRVRQRLAALLSASQHPRELRQASTGEPSPWQVYGSFGQNMRRDASNYDGQVSRVERSDLDTYADLIGRYDGEDTRVETRFSGGYLHSTLDSSENESRISNLYANIDHRPSGLEARLGRQHLSSSGVLGRFDGLYLSKSTFKEQQINFASGYPVASSRDGVDTNRAFYALSYDWKRLGNAWDLSTYAIEQQNGSLTDRQAIGGEFHYVSDGRTLFGLVDYDLMFNELNLITLIGNWILADNTVININLDQRRSPLLSTSNALIGQTLTSLEQLQQTYSDSAIRELAVDRSAIAQTVSFSINHPLSRRFQLNGDVTVSRIDAMPASGGVPAIPGTDNEYYYGMQLIGNELLRSNDIGLFGVRYAQTGNSNTVSLSGNLREPFGDKWRLNPRLRLDWRDYKDNALTDSQFSVVPEFGLDYRLSHSALIEFDSGLEWTRRSLIDSTETDIFTYFTLGYRLDF